jgi:hypothetical protein
MRIASFIVVAAACMWFGLQAPASAVQIPPGSYRETCESIQLQGGILTASCQGVDGQWHQASMNIDRCPGGPVANNDGALVCGPGGYGIGRTLPRGSWRASCRDASKSGGTLYAQCDDGNGGWHSTTLDMDDCPSRLAGNARGNLYCEGGLNGGALPSGSWRSSCKDASMSGSMLSASCDTGSGSWHSTSLDTSLCLNSSIGNSGGNLYCGSGRATKVLPPGSWRTTCRNGYIDGSVLHAECNDGTGSWRQASIDLRNCYGPIGNNHGTLYCAAGAIGHRIE